MAVFRKSSTCVTISNPDLLSSSETGVNTGIRSWKKPWSESARCQEVKCGNDFTKKWSTQTLQRGLEFEIFKPRPERGIFKCISSLDGLFLVGDHRGFLKEGVEASIHNGTNFAFYKSSTFSCIQIKSMLVVISSFDNETLTNRDHSEASYFI